MAVAAVLARQGLADSARHVAAAARSAPDIDPTRDLMYIDAFVQTLLDAHDDAIKSLKVYLAANPDRRSWVADESAWWFRGLQDDPKFKELVREK